ncbi:MAG: sugar ABC transporter ATP-binding protein [Chloroflexi bacterium]|nr:sugar ABC transporter ATP-binding protein [Chloroflexota bacterium]
MPDPIVQLQNITKEFPGVRALDQVSFSIWPGEIHAVVGENGAGKSTLMNILAGDLQPDSGAIIYKGKRQTIPNPFVSQQLGISVVYQELALCPNLTIAENMSLHFAASRPALSPVDRRGFRASAQSGLARFGIRDVDVNQPVAQLSVALQQLVEIAKAISTQSSTLILDEPNSALTPEETAYLFSILRQLREDGVAIIYVSHRLEEVLTLADRISVLRDGKLIETIDRQAATIETLIEKMVGRSVEGLFDRRIESEIGANAVLDVRNLSSGRALHEVSFQVHAGEAVGIAGLPDSGKDELVECLFGLRKRDGGEIRVNGKRAAINAPSSAIAQGIVLVPADRRGAGSLLIMNVLENIAAASLKAVSEVGLVRRAAMRLLAARFVSQLDIRTSGLAQSMGTLSGGNQQKVILARGLATNPSVLLLHEPTRGIDVGAKAEIYGILQRLAATGAAIVVVSSELTELIGQCDRILVMHAGRITGDFRRRDASEEAILSCAMGRLEHLAEA